MGRRIIALAFLCAPLCACDAASPRLADSAPIAWNGPAKTIVLATPDIELSELTAGGAEAPRADWTKSAIELTRKEITATLGARGVKIAEAFPEGRGSPHGCGLRARFTGMLPRARPGSRKG